MLVPQVSAELMMIAHNAATKAGRVDVIDTMLKEHSIFEFDDIYAATQRLYAFSHVLATSNDFDRWIVPPALGHIYSEIDPIIWQAVATTKLERNDEELFTQAKFDSVELQQFLQKIS
jgi:hypothetical protein